MSVIIRLQNLPWSANALDIRQYFKGLNIPEGGVHIVGGELGDAFIAFSTDEDARLAFQRNNGRIKEVQITLSLSSRTEMQRVIEAVRNQSFSAFAPSAQPSPVVPLPSAIPQIRPAVVPEVKIDLSKDKDRKDRKRSRSRDRRDRSRDRDRRRYRSRSRSRDRRSNKSRRDNRSRSRDRSRSRERDRRSRDASNKRRSNDVATSSNQQSTTSVNVVVKEQIRKIEPWALNDPIVQQQQQQQIVPPLLAASFASNFEELRRNLNVINPSLSGNGFGLGRGRESWPQSSLTSSANDFTRSSDDNYISERIPVANTNDPILPERVVNLALNEKNRSGRNNVFSSPKNTLDFEPSNRNSFEPRVYPNCCVKIEPFYGAYGDLRRFFHGCFISSRGIKFINDKSGTRTGIVYVQFGNPQSKVEALARNDECFSGVNLSIVHIDDKEFAQAVDRFVPRNNEDEEDFRQSKIFPNKTKFFNGKQEKQQQSQLQQQQMADVPKIFTCLIVEDLPNYVKEQDILKMFSHYPLTSIIIPPRGRGSHVAYVKFGSAEDAKTALSETTVHNIEGKPVTVRACKDEEYEKVNEQHEMSIAPSVKSKKKLLIDTDCLSISGLPSKTTDRDIADFFSDIGVIPVKIHFMSSNFRFTGEAFCEFETLEEAEKALEKDSCVLGTQLIKVVPIKREEMTKSLGLPLEGDVIESKKQERDSLLDHDDSNEKLDNDNDDIMMENNEDNDRLSPFQGGNINNNNFNQRHNMMFNQRNHHFEGNSRGGSRGGLFMGRGGGRGGMMFNRNFGHSQGIRPRMNNGPEDSVGDGCTVFMDNIPYKAGTNEILQFFDGYNVTNNVSRRFNHNNTPSAEAKVVFASAEEAFIAVREKNMQMIWDRPIYLRQV